MRFLLVLCAASVMFAAGGLSNRRAPGFSLMDSSGRQYDLYDYRGKVVLIDVMQTKCPHCKSFMTVLDQGQAKYGNRSAIFSVVNPPDSAQTVAKYIAETKTKVPMLFDCGQMAISYFKVTPQNPGVDLPHLFVIDANGWIVNDFEYGAATKDIFEGQGLFAEIDRVLAGKAAPKTGKK